MSNLTQSQENSEKRAALWGDYVGWQHRKDAEGGFISNTLKSYGASAVLDVALGDGVDSISLLKDGFDVFSNEQDPYFKKVASANATKENVTLKTTSLNWLSLKSGYPDVAFDGIICFGHSIGCVLDRTERVAVLKQFHALLKPSGVLIVDERNFHKVYEHIKVGEPFRPSGKYVYTGSNKISLKFLERTSDVLTIQYQHNEKGISAVYRVYPYKPGEMLSELREANFENVQISSDYAPGLNPTCDYYQYIAIK